jgi:hypothetical protein
LTKPGLLKDISPATDRAEDEPYDKVGLYSESDLNFWAVLAMLQ